MATKIEIVNSAYSQLRISGLTVQPTPEDIETAMWRLEDMMAELEENRNICVGYNFEENPDQNTESGVRRAHHHMMATNLAVRLIPDFNKAENPRLAAQASQSLATTSSAVAAQNIREIQYPRRQARGSGNTLRFNRWQRFYRPEYLPPNECETKRMTEGDINDYEESFEGYLAGETIASFTITESDGLTIQSSSNNDNIVSYRVKAEDVSSSGSAQSVTIVVTTSTGRITTRVIEFEVSS